MSDLLKQLRTEYDGLEEYNDLEFAEAVRQADPDFTEFSSDEFRSALGLTTDPGAAYAAVWGAPGEEPADEQGVVGNMVDSVQQGAYQGLSGLAETSEQLFGAGEDLRDWAQQQAEAQELTMSPEWVEASKQSIFAQDDEGDIIFGEGAGNWMTWASQIGNLVGQQADMLAGGVLAKGVTGTAKLVAAHNAIKKARVYASAKGLKDADKLAKLEQRVAGMAKSKLGSKIDDPTRIAAYGATEAALAGGQAGIQAREEVLAMDAETLAASDTYQSLLAEHGDPERARAELAEITATAVQKNPLMIASNAILGSWGGAKIEQMLKGTLASSRKAAALKGAGVEAISEGPQGAIEQYAGNTAIQEYADPNRERMEGVVVAGLNEAVVAGVPGGMAGLRSPAQPKDTLSQIEDKVRNDLDQLKNPTSGDIQSPAAQAFETMSAEAEAANIAAGVVPTAAELQQNANQSLNNAAPLNVDGAPDINGDLSNIDPKTGEILSPDTAQLGLDLDAQNTQKEQENQADSVPRGTVSANEFKATITEANNELVIDGKRGAIITELKKTEIPYRFDMKTATMRVPAKYRAQVEMLLGVAPMAETAPTEQTGAVATAADIAAEAAQAAAAVENDLTPPSMGQINANNYKKGHPVVHGLKISVENPAGSKRKPEWPAMTAHYGDLLGTKGADNEPVDVFIKPDVDVADSNPVFIINQYVDGKFDEHKVMMGYTSLDDATDAYNGSFTEGWDGLHSIHQLSADELKGWLKHGNTKAEFKAKADPAFDLKFKENGERATTWNNLPEFVQIAWAKEAGLSGAETKQVKGQNYGRIQNVAAISKLNAVIDKKREQYRARRQEGQPQTTAPVTEAKKAPITPDEVQAANYEQKAAELKLSEPQKAAFTPETTRDQGTGLYLDEERAPTVQRVLDADMQGVYVEAEIHNLAGMNEVLAHHKADSVITEIVKAFTGELGEAGIYFRNGGPVFSGVLVDAAPADVRNKMKAVQAKVAEIVKKHGLENVPHKKFPDSDEMRGVGLYYGAAGFKPGQSLDAIFTDAQQQITDTKPGEKENVIAETSTTPWPVSLSRQARGAKTGTGTPDSTGQQGSSGRAQENRSLLGGERNQADATTGAVRTRLTTPEQKRLDTHNARADQHGLTDAQREALTPTTRKDSVTGWFTNTDRVETARRAQQHSKDTAEPAVYVSIDIANLGGLNNAVGREGADTVFSAMADIITEHFDRVDNTDSIKFRHGGDELSLVVINAEQKAVDAVMADATAEIAEYIQSKQLDTIEHPKHKDDDTRRGVGIYYGLHEIDPSADIGKVIDRADKLVELQKAQAIEAKAQAEGVVESKPDQEKPAAQPASESNTDAQLKEAESVLEAAGITGEAFINAIEKFNDGKLTLSTLKKAYPAKVETEAKVETDQEAVTAKPNWRQNIYSMVSKGVFKDIVSNAIQNDGQKVLDAADSSDIETLNSMMIKYGVDVGRNEGGGGAGPGKVKRARAGAETVWNAARISIENIEKETSEPADETNAHAEKITDLGEKIGGARKDVWSGFREKIENTLSDDEILSLPLSKSFPEPNYAKLAEQGADPMALAAIKVMRDEIPAKSRKRYKQAHFVEQVKLLRDSAQEILANPGYAEKFINGMRKNSELSKLSDRIDLMIELGFPQTDINLKGLTLEKRFFSLWRGEENVTKWIVDVNAVSRKSLGGMGGQIAATNTREEAVTALKSYLAAQANKPKGKNATKFEVYKYKSAAGAARGWIVGKKIGRNHVDLSEGFKTSAEARLYVNANHAALEEKLAKFKEIPSHRRPVNEARLGEDYRAGKDVSAQEFKDTFGFRGIEFGNWVEQRKRQQDINDAYDALMDLAKLLDIPPQAISLNSELGLAFGARGGGGINAAKAHYEPGKIVINLTKKDGAGSLAHEWLHGLDNYFSRMRGDGLSYVTNRPYELTNKSVRPEVLARFKGITSAIKASGLPKRAVVLDGKRTKDYWGTMVEMAARSFESYVITKLKEKGISNDYLANIVSPEYWKAAEALGLETENSYPYILEEEQASINEAYDAFFNEIKTKETDKGTALFKRTTQSATSGLTLADAQSNVDRITASWKNAPDITVVNTQNELPGEILDYANEGDVIDGVFHNGQVYIVAENMRDQQHLEFTLLHEATLHYGMRQTFGKAEFDKILNALYSINADVRMAASKKMIQHGIGKLEAVEEVLADMAGSGKAQKLNGWKRLVKFIQQWLADNGFNKLAELTAKDGENLTTQDRMIGEALIEYVLAASKDAVVEGRTMGGMADSTLHSKQGEPFYSQMQTVLADKLPGKGTGASYRNTVQAWAKKGEFKQEEYEWSGVDEWLQENAMKKLTKQDVLDYLAANQIEVKEVVKGYGSLKGKSEQEILDDAYAEFESDFSSGLGRAEMLVNEMDVISENLSAWDNPEHIAWKHIGKTKNDYLKDAMDDTGYVYMHDAKSEFNDDFEMLAFDEIFAPAKYEQMKEKAWQARKVGYVQNARFLANQSLEMGGQQTGLQYANYQTPGGENYRELLLTLPEKLEAPKKYNVLPPVNPEGNVTERKWSVVDDEGTLIELAENEAIAESKKRDLAHSSVRRDNYQSSHYDEPNILAHVRYNERTDAKGKRVLFVEEVQSDWHQAGRKGGYGKQTSFVITNDEGHLVGNYPTMEEAEDALPGMQAAKPEETLDIVETDEFIEGVPDAPFKTTWPLLAMKRMIRHAAENGFDSIAWTTGEMQAERYDLSKQVDSIKAQKKKDGSYYLRVYQKDGDLQELEPQNDNELANTIGKELAEKISKQEIREGQNSSWLVDYEGDNLKVGGEGMKGFYDDILPKTMNKYVKKWGGKVGDTGIVVIDSKNRYGGYLGYAADDFYQNEKSLDEARAGLEAAYPNEEKINIENALSNSYPRNVHALPITDKMRDAALQGQPLFSRQPANRNPGIVDKARDSETTKAFVDGFEQASSLVKQQRWGLLTMRQMTDVISKHLPALKAKFIPEVQRMEITKNTWKDRGGKLAENRRGFGGDRSIALSEVQHEATIAGVDPSLGKYVPLTDAATVAHQIKVKQEQMRGLGGDARALADLRKQIKDLKMSMNQEENRKKAYPSLKTMWDALDAEQKQQFKNERDFHSDLFKEQREALMQRIIDTVEDEDLRKSLMDKLRSEFENNQVEQPYFPLARFGDYFVHARDKDGEETFDMFTSESAKRRFIAEVEATPGAEVLGHGLSLKDYNKISEVDTGFLIDVDEKINELGKDPAVLAIRDGVYQLYLQQLPGMSSRKSQIHRKKRKGYHRDQLRGFAHAAVHGANSLARLKHGHLLKRELDQAQELLDLASSTGRRNAMNEEIEAIEETLTNPDNPQGFIRKMEKKIENRQAKLKQAEKIKKDDQVDYLSPAVSELRSSYNAMMNPQTSTLASSANAFGFTWFLGASISSAIVNLFQTPVVSYPMLSARVGYGAATKAFRSAYSDFAAGKGSVESKLSAEEKIAYQYWHDTGLLTTTLSHDLAGVAEAGIDTGSFKNKFMRTVSFMFHKAEVVNREVTALATYRAAREKGQSAQAAMELAEELTWNSHFDYTSGNRARFMRGNAMRVITQFKQYSQNITYLYAKTINDAFRDESPEMRLQARRTLYGMMTGQILVAGSLGLPMSTVAIGIAQALTDGFGDDDDPVEVNAEIRAFLADAFGETGGRFVAKGFFDAFTPFGIHGRLSLSDLWLRTSDMELEGRAHSYDLMKALLGPMASVFEGTIVGADLMTQGEVQRGVEYMLPKALKDAIKAARFATEDAQTMSGRTIREMGPWESLAQLSGFSNAELSDIYGRNTAVRNVVGKRQQRRNDLIDAMIQASDDRDMKAIAKARNAIKTWNEKNTGTRITAATVSRRRKGIQRRSSEMGNGIYVGKGDRDLVDRYDYIEE